MKAARRLQRALRGSLLVACVQVLPAQDQDWIRAHYEKREAMVPMRDGTLLFTAIYAPRSAGSRPILLKRTPYGVEPYGEDVFPEDLGPGPVFAKEGFIFAYQDVRGRGMSQGRFVNMTPHRVVKSSPNDIDESTDTFDTIAWLLAHVPGNNGKVGQWGISYPGFYAAAGMINAHPALVACSPQAPILDWFGGDDFHRNGAFWLLHFYNFIAWFGQTGSGAGSARPPSLAPEMEDSYAFFLKTGALANVDARYFRGRIPFWNEVMAHGTRDDFWKARDLRPHLRNIRPAVLAVGGWYDAENLFGTLELHRRLAAQSPATPLTLVMGPWFHGAWERDAGERLGALEFGSATSDYFQEKLEFPFFMHYLKGAPDPRLPRAVVFQTGTNRWEAFDAWPPRRVQATRLYFESGGRLARQAPVRRGGEDAFTSDPARPVPFLEGPARGMSAEYMVADQRFVAGRRDVLTYRTAPLPEDLVVAGPIRVHLAVSTTGTDADWVVKVIDEHPPTGDPLPGFQQLVRGEVMRGKFRNSLERPEPFIPGQPTEVAWDLSDVFHAFRKGHRLTVQVQSSWFPLMDRNPQVFMDIYAAGARDFRSAIHRLHHSAAWASYLELPVLPSARGLTTAAGSASGSPP